MPKNKKNANKNYEAENDILSSEGESEGEGQNTGNNTGTGRQNRNEKKARKMLSKLNFKSLTGITKVIIKKSKQTFFVVQAADVYKSPSSDTYIIFGEAKIEDLNSQAQSDAAQLFTQMAFKVSSMEADKVKSDPESKDSTKPKDTESVVVDVTDSAVEISEKDINLVMSQVSCSMEEAKRALIENNGDIVDAIIQLTN
ncbi:nascent polypeptide-associated complex subunit alpha [Babesia microti strain RI]|uniref:Nascent polypeptide-associated complex subunit alpha n=1 Tax=Babesia microti (strain RI) TaxID=1133968 RepID=I7I9R4_BABMR|nr:nascent polypeptide-associated complex subunit alpha [Babesia microti strain RI]CCF75494.1 nascent polypeptide-associated complex subunit alpha [Babesia microti strain RI]|eukprot:XP_012649902.1 nascent polypeptide-associated complex subunit alpha [Babesia microti strain RI]